MTLVRRLAAAGSLSILLAVATAPLAAADDDSPPPPAPCEVLVILALPCELDLPPAPGIDLPVEPVIRELVPALARPIEELVPLPVTELVSPAVPGLLPPVLGIGNAQATYVPAAAVANLQPAVDPPAAPTGATPATPEAASQRQVDPEAPFAVATAATAPATGSWRQLNPAELDGASERLATELPATPPPIGPAVALTLTLGGGAALAVELARGGGSWAGAVAFNVWLRRQLREARMSQRQLAVVSGVDHSTISRLMSGRREPSLATATRITEALRKLNGMPHAGEYFARQDEAPVLPTKRVEAALLGDEELDDSDVRELMQAYIVARARRRRARNAAANNGEPIR